MPHKHTRRRSTSPIAYDLPPTTLARPLPTFTPKTTKPKPLASKPSKSTRPTTIARSTKPTRTSHPTKPTKSANTPHLTRPTPSHPHPTPTPSTSYPLHDTPRAFTLLLHPRPPPRSCLDDGPLPPRKKRKPNPAGPTPPASTTAPPPPTTNLPLPKPQQAESQHAEKSQILPHETLSSFSARVDAALPVRGLTAKGQKMKGQGRQTRMERGMQRMQRSWRGEEERRQAKRAEMMEEVEDGEGGDVEVGGGRKGGKGGKKSGRGRGIEEEGDVWAGIGGEVLREEEGRGGGLVGLHDVVRAPPRFKVMGGGGKGVGVGLKRQGELGEARRAVVEGYRALMRERGREGAAAG